MPWPGPGKNTNNRLWILWPAPLGRLRQSIPRSGCITQCTVYVLYYTKRDSKKYVNDRDSLVPFWRVYVSPSLPSPRTNMLTYFFLLIFFWWALLLLTFVPALAVGLLCAWRRNRVGWRKGLLAGLIGGFAGVACSLGWYWFEGLVLLPEASNAYIGYLLLPIPSGMAAWAICRFRRRRRDDRAALV